MSKKRRKIKNKVKIFLFLIIFIISSVTFYYFYYNKQNKNNYEKEFLYMKQNYDKHVITKKEIPLYKKSKNGYKKIGSVSSSIVLTLADILDEKDLYYKLLNMDYYVYFKDVEKVKDYKENFNDKRFKNYIPYNENIFFESGVIYLDDNKKYTINEEVSLPILVKEDDRYYVSYDDKFMYVLKKDVKILEHSNSKDLISDHFAILNYHYIAKFDDINCQNSLCTSFETFDSHLNYLKENNFFTLSMKEVEWFIDDKINLPKNSVAITIDDGWYANFAIFFLEKYNMKATLFLIGEVYDTKFDKNLYISDYLDIHSHGYDLHETGYCNIPNTRGGAILCMEHDSLINDLKKSREWLDNTTVFCYPFYEYNDYAISALKEAGFTMAMAGGSSYVYKKIDKYKVPRFGTTRYTEVSDIARILSY